MSARGGMRHRAEIERDANAGQTDPGGQPLPEDYQPHLPAVPCSAWIEPREEITQDGAKTVVIEGRRMIVPLGTDVTEADRVATVSDRLGNVIFTGPSRIESVGRRQDHLALILREIT